MNKLKGPILITGGTGFIGSHLVKFFESQGQEVLLITRNARTSGDHRGRQFVLEKPTEGDWTDRLSKLIQTEKPQAVFHLASLYLQDHKAQDIEPLITSNVLLGTKILEALAHASPQTPVLLAGSGWQSFSESDNSPVNLYAATKAAFAQIARYYASAKSMKVVELQIFDTFGDHDPRRKVIQLLFEISQQKTESPVAFSAGEQKLAPLHVSDVVYAFSKARDWLELEKPGTFRSFRVSNDTLLSLRDLAKEIEVLVGKPLPIQWGARDYRPREVMSPDFRLPTVPGWTCQSTLKDSLRAYYKHLCEKN